MRLNAVPQIQGSVTERSPQMPARCLALADLASRILGVQVHKVDQVKNTSTTEAKVANRTVRHPGDSDSTGAIAGNLIGAMCADEAMPARSLEQVEMREVF